MTRIAPIPPAESDLLCEFCGYTLNGLDEQSKCPECGMPIAASLGQERQPPIWEWPDGRGVWKALIVTTIPVLLRPTAFFKSITARGNVRRASVFGHIHWLIASILFGVAGMFHLLITNPNWRLPMAIFIGGIGILAILSYLSLWGTTLLAVRLTAWEAAYRGYRLPRPVVMRAMYYHAAHYLPVALLALATVLVDFTCFDALTVVKYLYVLCAEIILAAAYLFKTYWIGMRNMMYANV